MDSRKIALRETGIIAVGEIIGVTLMVGMFALLKRLDLSVLLGGLVGGMLSVANFFVMAVAATLAADRAEKQEVEAGRKLLRNSYPIRLLALFAVLFVCAKSGYFNVIALVLPLAFTRPTISIAEFFRKKGD